MTIAARKVLNDCEIALEMLEEVEDLGRWRLLWAGSVALLRAVGHVLKKIDGESPQIRVVIDRRFDDWKRERQANSVFWDFIENERNNILKEYRSSVSPDEEILLTVQADGPSRGAGDMGQKGQVFRLSENIYRPIVSGYGEGEDARDIYRQALDWWGRELAAIEELSKRE